MNNFLKIGILLTGVAWSMVAGAVDTPLSTTAPDLAKARALIKAQDYKGAATELYAAVDRGTQHADVYSLLGFTLRKSGDLKSAQTYYRKALDFDPNHKGALEYQGEMYVIMRDINQARQNLAKLVALCPLGCEERSDLEKAIGAATASN